MIKYILGWIVLFEAAFLCVPLITAAVYHERAAFSVMITMGICLALGGLGIWGKPKNRRLFARDGFIIVALGWILLSILGALPFVFSKSIPNFVDALFESASGFTTTGASVLPNVEILPKSILMWRSFSHWIGGMGVLVFVMAILPLCGAHNMHIMRAESPGPSVSKLVPKVRSTAMILYGIYIVLTLLEFILLACGDMTVFEAANTAFATAGTGGFGIKNDSMASFSAFTQIVVTVFMLLFSINFNVYYLLLCFKVKEAFNLEFKVFFVVVFLAIGIITVNVVSAFANAGLALRHVAFTVASIVSTTGFATVDFNLWPQLSRVLLVALMFMGACAGSTGGGMKVSRFVILFKGAKAELKRLVHPNQVKKIMMDGRPVEHETVRSVNVYVFCYTLIFLVSLLLISLDGFDFATNFTSIAATINNIGPGLNAVGPTGNYAGFSVLSKLVMTFDMIAGRLEIFPMLLLLVPSTWRK